MKLKLIRGDISVGKSPIHGYGVFANQQFHPGDIIEECYCLLFDPQENSFTDYVYGVDGSNLFPLGCGSIINHSQQENAKVEYDPKHSLLTFIATKSIKPGEEVLTNYGEGWFNKRGYDEKISLKIRLRHKLKRWRVLLRFSICLVIVLGSIWLISIAT